MAMFRETRMILWDREDITYCKCPSLRYAHAHCPCEECNGKAVSRSTEYRHWVAVKEHLRCMQQGTTSSTSHTSINVGSPVETDVQEEPRSRIEPETEMIVTQPIEGVTNIVTQPDDQSINYNDNEQEVSIESEHGEATGQ